MGKLMENKENQIVTETSVNDSRLSFGAYLKKTRIEKGLSIEDIMDYTRISKYVLQQIEEVNASKLPEAVYLKGFLKSYAQAMGIDPSDVLERYKRYISKDEEKKERDREKKHIPNNQFPFMKLIGFILVIVIVAGSLIVIVSHRDSEKNTSESTVALPSEPSATAPEATSSAPATDVPAKATTDGQESKAADGGLSLEVICVEPTTIKISVDDGAPEEHTLNPQDHLGLKAEETYNILIGNACGVHLFLNKKPVNIPGKCGQSVNMLLP
jgi:cytoskeletal protein RodZ